MIGREELWAAWMRAARGGDSAAYEQLLVAIAASLRPGMRRRFAQMGLGTVEAEDVVQEVLIAVHTKRSTWDETRPFLPWLGAVTRHKMLDAARRLGRDRRRQADLPAEAWADFAAPDAADPDRTLVDAERALARLSTREEGVVRAIAIDGSTVGETALRLQMSPGAVRVAFHRGLRRLLTMARTSPGGTTCGVK